MKPNANSRVYVFGGANMDIQGYPNSSLVYRDSNPGKIIISFGGVGRNIAENLARLGQQVSLVTVLGDDDNGKKIYENATRVGIDMQYTEFIPGEDTSTYLAILDENKDMSTAIAAMDITNHITIEGLRKVVEKITSSDVAVVDANLNSATIAWLCDNLPCPIFCDPVSTKKAVKVISSLSKITHIKPNSYELATLAKMDIKNDDDLVQAAAKVIKKGVKNLYVSLGAEGVYYVGEGGTFRIKAKDLKIESATGGGDALVSGLVYAYLHGLNAQDGLKFALACSTITLESKSTVSIQISEQKAKQYVGSINFEIKGEK